MTTHASIFVYPNLPIDNLDHKIVVDTPQPLADRNILFVNCDATEPGLSTVFENFADVDEQTLHIFVGPMAETEDPIGRFNRAADNLCIPDNERRAHSRQINSLVYYHPVSISLLHNLRRNSRMAAADAIEIHVDTSFAMQIDKAYFVLLAVHCSFAPGTMRKLKVHLEGETLVADLPNGPWFLPSSVTTELKVAAEYCSMILPAYDGTAISSLTITDPIIPVMLQLSYDAHLNAVLKTLHENSNWITHFEITLAFADSLFTVLNACMGLKHFTSLAIAECDPSSMQVFNPNDAFKEMFLRKLQRLIGLRKLKIPTKLQSEYLALWYPHIDVTFEQDWDTQAQSIRAFYKAAY